MPTPYWTLESEGTSLALNDSTYALTEVRTPMPELAPQYAGGWSDGDLVSDSRYQNRVITLTVLVMGADATALEAAVNALQRVVGKQNQDARSSGRGGTIKFTTASGNPITFDVVAASIDVQLARALYAVENVVSATLEFTCLPFGRGAEMTAISDTAETTLPYWSAVAADVPGDVAALGRLVVDEDDGEDQACVLWGIRSRNYSADATAALFWQAEALTPVSASAATAVGPSGAHGSGSNTIEADALTTEWQDVLKSTVGSTYFTHVGAYRVLARVQADATNTGDVQVRASWGLGDLAVYQQGAAASTMAGAWVLCDLGVVNIPQALTGTHRWEFRLQAKSSVNGEDVFVDWIMLVPVDESAGVAQVTGSGTNLVTLVHDDFSTHSGSLDGNTPSPTADGNWAESSAGEFTLDTTNDVAQRTSTGDTAGLANAKFAVASSAVAGSWANVDVTPASAPGSDFTGGALLRYVDASNWLAVGVQQAPSAGYVRLVIYKRVAGTVALLGASDWRMASGGTTFRVRVSAYARGLVTSDLSFDGTPVIGLSVTDSDLVTSGALDDGKIGVFDHYPSGTACTRQYDNFQGGTLTSNAACFASQSIRIAHDGVVREDSAGAVWGNPGKVEGDLLLLPPAGREARSCQVLVKMSRAQLGSPGDLAADDISATLYATPRYLTLPT